MRPTNFEYDHISMLSFDNYHLGLYHQQNSTAPKQVYPALPSFSPAHTRTRLAQFSDLELKKPTQTVPAV